MCELARFYGWTFAEIRSMPLTDLSTALGYRNQWIRRHPPTSAREG